MDSVRAQIPFCVQPWIEINFHLCLSVRLPHSILAEFQDLVSKIESPFIHSRLRYSRLQELQFSPQPKIQMTWGDSTPI